MYLAVLDKSKYTEPISPGFEELANAFFNGEEIYGMEYYESKAKCQNTLDKAAENGIKSVHSATSSDNTDYNLPDDAQDLESNVNKSYEITDNGGDWAKVLRIAEDEDLTNESSFFMLMTDLFLNADIENAARKHSLYHGFRVFPQAGLIKDAEKQLEKIQEWENCDATYFEIVKVEDSSVLATGNTTAGEEKRINPTRPLSASRVSIPIDNDDWVNKKPVPENPTPGKQSGKKKGKNGKKYNVKQHKPASIVSNEETAVDSDDMTEGQVTHPTKPPPEPTSAISMETLGEFDDGGDWNVVQPKFIRKPSGPVRRPPNFPNRNRGTVARPASIHQRQLIPSSSSVSTAPLNRLLFLTAFLRIPPKTSRHVRYTMLRISFNSKDHHPADRQIQ
jgi:hypothetical protein